MKRITGLIAIALSLTFLGACAKKREEKNDNPNYASQYGEFTTASIRGGEYTFTRTVEDADNRNAFYAIPGFHLDFGTVKVELTEQAVRLVAIGEADNSPEVSRVIAEFPVISYFDRVKQKNEYGEETNVIIEEQKRPWNQRDYVRVDFARPTDKPSQVVNMLWSVGAIGESSVTLIQAPRIEPDGTIYWSTDSNIIENQKYYGFEFPMSYRVKTGAFLVPLKKNNDFTPREYTDSDFSRYGYFRTTENFQDPEKGLLDSTVKHYANVFNVCEPGTGRSCSTNKIVYYLTDNFPKEYADLSEKAVKEWNNAFRAALGRGDDVVVLDRSRTVPISDTRHNVIAYYDAEIKMGLLGVSQTRVDSRTGETLNARSTMYGAGIRYTTGMVGDLLALIKENPGAFPGCGRSVTAQAHAHGEHNLDFSIYQSDFGAQLKNQTDQIRKNLGITKQKSGLSKTNFKFQPEKVVRDLRDSLIAGLPPGGAHGNRELMMSKDKNVMVPAQMAKMGGSLPPWSPFEKPASSEQEMKDGMYGMKQFLNIHEQFKLRKKENLKLAALGIHTHEFVDDATIRYIELFAKKNPALCQNPMAFEAALKRDVANLTFYTTVLHEMGHNFGLRHNFEASADRENYQAEYYKIKNEIKNNPNMDPEEVKKKQAEMNFYAYSSVMDYGFGFYDVQSDLGRYDKYAIRYGYHRSLNADDPVKRANLKFCTDHQLFEKSTCRQFDQGATVTEITLNTIDRYNKSYIRTHFRRDRYEYENRIGSVIGNVIQRTMIPLRLTMDDLIYQIIVSPSVPASGNQCGALFFRKSIEAKEITNICDGYQAELDGVNVLDWSTFVYGLYKPETIGTANPQFRVQPSEYITNGFADMVLSNALASNYFANVIGAPEAGSYLAWKETTERNFKFLGRLSNPNNPDAENEAYLRNLASEEGIPPAQVEEFVKEQKKNVAVVPAGPFGKIFDSYAKEEAGYLKLQNVGYIWDKIFGGMVLGARDLGIAAYAQQKMTGNAYFWPQTEKIVTKLVDRQVTERPYVVNLATKLPSGEAVDLPIPGSMDQDTQLYGVLTGLMDFNDIRNQAFVDKMRVCIGDFVQCQSFGAGQPSVEFKTAGGNSVIKAIETPEGDSISVYQVLQGKTIRADVDRQESIMKESPQLRVVAGNNIRNGEAKRLALENLMKSEPSLAKWIPYMTGKQPVQDPSGTIVSAWWVNSYNVDNFDKIGLFHALETAQYTFGVMAAVQEDINKLKPNPPLAKKNPRFNNSGINADLYKNGPGMDFPAIPGSFVPSGSKPQALAKIDQIQAAFDQVADLLGNEKTGTAILHFEIKAAPEVHRMRLGDLRRQEGRLKITDYIMTMLSQK